MKCFIVLICAHILADFVLQPDQIAQNKHRWGVLSLHAGVHALLSWLLFGFHLPWQIPVIIFLSHFLIDFLKQKVSDTACTFCVDQCLHVLVLAVLAYGLHRAGVTDQSGLFYKPLVLLSGLVVTVQGSGFLVSKVAQRIIGENDLKVDGLNGGGKLIGQLERSVIFLLIMMGQPAGIGFLVAAKSILRFKDSEDQRLAEYVLIGTLLSFGLAMGLSTLTVHAMRL